MGYHEVGPNIRYGLIAFDAAGTERAEGDGMFTHRLIGDAEAVPVTDVFFFCHGWKGDVPAAVDQYDKWIGAFMHSPDLQKAKHVFPDFNPMLIGLHWPSQPWGEEEAKSDGSFAIPGSAGANDLLEGYIERFGNGPEIIEPLSIIINEARINISPGTLPNHVRQAYLDLNEALGLLSGGVSAPPDADREGFDPEDSYRAGNADGASFSGSSLGDLLGPLRQLSYWTMKKRARTVGEGGMHDFLKALQISTSAKKTRIHLMGHSFGTIVVSGMVGGVDAKGELERKIQSVALIQGAVSLWSYASRIPFHNAGSGYFYPNLASRKVMGPIVTTQSSFDDAVGRFYPLASRLWGSASFAGVVPEFGALGTYGIQGLENDVKSDARMLPVTGHYGFEQGRVYNLDSSQYICHGEGASGAHNDIAGPEVAHVLWEAAFSAVGG